MRPALDRLDWRAARACSDVQSSRRRRLWLGPASEDEAAAVIFRVCRTHLHLQAWLRHRNQRLAPMRAAVLVPRRLRRPSGPQHRTRSEATHLQRRGLEPATEVSVRLLRPPLGRPQHLAHFRPQVLPRLLRWPSGLQYSSRSASV